jgi:dTDP-4-dehydrorhamnose 3,5-epimerase
MHFTPLPLEGAYTIMSEPLRDERGSFSRTWDSDEFESRGLASAWTQTSLSWNRERDTLRGLHYQVPPHEEVKLVTCVHGSIWDVIVDLRPESPTYRKWHGVELSSDDSMSVYVPRRFAHGYQTLEPDSVVLYQITAAYRREASRGLRWDDPALQIEWPNVTARIISIRDTTHPLLDR